jgi:hypothetical protein
MLYLYCCSQLDVIGAMLLHYCKQEGLLIESATGERLGGGRYTTSYITLVVCVFNSLYK